MNIPAKVSGTQALILSGGGAQAAYEVGVMSELLPGHSPATDYTPVDPGVLVGTSAGSINAGLLLSVGGGSALEATKYMEDVWLEDMATFPGKCCGGVYRLRAEFLAAMNSGCVLAHPVKSLSQFAADSTVLARTAARRAIGFVMSRGAIEQKALEFIDISALISSDPLAELVQSKVRLDEVRRSSWKLRVAATNWRTGEVRVFDKGEMTDDFGHRILLASSALPGIFPPVEIEGDPYVDGGVVMNTPLKPAIDAGADTLHIICMDPDMSRVPLGRSPSTLTMLSRSIEINLRTAIVEDIGYATAVNQAIALTSGQISRPETTEVSSRHLARAAVKQMVEPETEPARRPLTMHLHYPSGGLNVGWLSFERDSIARLIKRGREDAIYHDCAANHCVFPAA